MAVPSNPLAVRLARVGRGADAGGAGGRTRARTPRRLGGQRNGRGGSLGVLGLFGGVGGWGGEGRGCGGGSGGRGGVRKRAGGVGETGGGGQYGANWVEMAGALKANRGRLVWEAKGMGRVADVSMRIDRILDETRPISAGVSRRWRGALLACGLPLVYAAAVLHVAPAIAQEQKQIEGKQAAPPAAPA